MPELTRFMSLALALAERGRGHVEPNPLVGAVVVSEDAVVGEGWHQKYGQAHAEVNALAAAGERARGATLYVTLEPCCHWGKTPPCTDAIIAAGVRRVVVALADPFPEVDGKGLEALRRAGIDVEPGEGEARARIQNAPYLKLLTTGRPYVRLKWAMTLDGKICTHSGDSKWISDDLVLTMTRAERGLLDAILVGIGTALADDPLLTARPAGPRVPLRIVLDNRGRLPLTSRLVQTCRDVPLLVAGAQIGEAQRQGLLDAGAEVFALPSDRRQAIEALLDELGGRRLTNLLVEGGAEVLGSFLDVGAADEVEVCVGPMLLGGAGRSPTAGLGVDRIRDGLRYDVEAERIGDCFLIRGRRRA